MLNIALQGVLNTIIKIKISSLKFQCTYLAFKEKQISNFERNFNSLILVIKSVEVIIIAIVMSLFPKTENCCEGFPD